MTDHFPPGTLAYIIYRLPDGRYGKARIANVEGFDIRFINFSSDPELEQAFGLLEHKAE